VKLVPTVLVVASALINVSIAQAAPTLINAGLNGYSGTLDCRYRTNGQCDWASTNPTGYDMLGTTTLTSTSAASQVVDPLRGTASSSANLSASSYLPELHAVASSNGAYSPSLGNANPAIYTGEWSSIADANIWGVQAYQYDGLTPFDLTVTATLDSIFSASGQNGKIGHSGFHVSIFDAAGYSFTYDGLDIDTCPIRGATARQCAGGPQVYAHNFAGLYDTGSVSVTLHHTVNTGDRFYVGAFLDASVCCGETADSSHTLQMAFNDFSQLSSFAVAGVVAPAAAVPEPTSILLMATGIGGLIAARRRRRPMASSLA
jgi:hypothetical protein